MAASADIYLEHGRWGRPLALSVLLHGLLFGGILLWGVIGLRIGEAWGGGGGGDGAMNATLVSSLTVPLPATADRFPQPASAHRWAPLQPLQSRRLE